jgi:hypothetical protein
MLSKPEAHSWKASTQRVTRANVGEMSAPSKQVRRLLSNVARLRPDAEAIPDCLQGITVQISGKGRLQNKGLVKMCDLEGLARPIGAMPGLRHQPKNGTR